MSHIGEKGVVIVQLLRGKSISTEIMSKVAYIRHIESCERKKMSPRITKLYEGATVDDVWEEFLKYHPERAWMK